MNCKFLFLSVSVYLPRTRRVRRALAIAAVSVLAFAFHTADAPSLRAENESPLAQGSPDSSGLDEAECDQLYSHQLKIIQSDPDNPLYSSVQLNAGVLENPATRQAEIRHCRERVSRESFECQLAAEDLAGLLACRRKFENENGDATNAEKPGDAAGDDRSEPESQEAYFEDLSNKSESGQSGRPETMPSGRFAVNAANCSRAYNHIYGIISNTKSFQERPDRARLTEYWQSAEARNSFAARCLAKFKPEDLGCLLSTRDADVLQGCLLVIPAG